MGGSSLARAPCLAASLCRYCLERDFKSASLIYWNSNLSTSFPQRSGSSLLTELMADFGGAGGVLVWRWASRREGWVPVGLQHCLAGVCLCTAPQRSSDPCGFADSQSAPVPFLRRDWCELTQGPWALASVLCQHCLDYEGWPHHSKRIKSEITLQVQLILLSRSPSA